MSYINEANVNFVGLHHSLCEECWSHKFPTENDNETSLSSSFNEGKDFGPSFERQERERDNANV